MTVLIMECVPPSLRGECTRYMLEIKAGVFIGTLSAVVREKLWEMVQKERVEGSALIAYASNTEQGFLMEMCGDPKRKIIDMEGLQLIKTE